MGEPTLAGSAGRRKEPNLAVTALALISRRAIVDTATLVNQIMRFFTERLSLEVPSEETDLFETGVLDSLTFVELLVHLERQFDIRVSMDELEPDHFRSVAKIAEFLTSRNGVGRAAA